MQRPVKNQLARSPFIRLFASLFAGTARAGVETFDGDRQRDRIYPLMTGTLADISRPGLSLK